MDLNVWEGTINGWSYVGPALGVSVASVFGYLGYEIRNSNYHRAVAMYERGYLDEQPTFWSTGRLMKEYNKKALERGLKIWADIDLPPLEGSIEYNRREQEKSQK